ncbi:MAG TPA: sigma-70 family RNA polymerase sigma factor [Candidatus Solibacter sp.]|jgi:RNA polymerase sigma-70 factor (ECF subfamily)|nr:sigma-70 family RNA polymerase sigma factor [Candidatus Solibacter sp.]
MAGQVIPREAILETRAARAEAELETMEMLVALHTAMIFRIAYSILRNHHDAEDAVQECFLRVLRYGKRMDEVRNVKTWLARIAWTVALDRRAPQNTVSLNNDESGEPLLEKLQATGRAPDDQAAGEQMRKLLEHIIPALPEDLRHPLELSTVQELNSSEIAEVLNIPESSVRTRLMRARRLLKEKLSALMEVKRHG